MNIPVHYYGLGETGGEARKGANVMNFYLAEQIAKDRLREARDMATVMRLMGDARPASQSLRVTLGLGLIRLGRSLAGRAPKGTAGPRRATA